MTEVIPLRGIVYNASRVSGADVVAPPYDVITPELREALYLRSEYNIVRVDFGAEFSADNPRNNKYTRAAGFLEQWQREEILVRSGKACFYAYEMEYATAGGPKKTRGFFGLVRLEELGNGIYPHEETHAKPKVDRLNLLTSCRANTSPIFSLYNSPAKAASGVVGRVAATKPYLEAQDLQGSVHRLWRIEGDDDIRTISADLAGKAIFIADGHHRYETALEYRRIVGSSQGAGPHDYVLMFLANIAEGDLTILPTHRIVRYNTANTLETLSEHFDIEVLPAGDDIVKAMRGRSRTMGLFLKEDGGQYLLTCTDCGLDALLPAVRTLDVSILHELVLKKLLAVSATAYEMDAAIARKKVSEGGYDAAFFLNPTLVEDVERVALSLTRMPPKSTYFYPKVMTGFVINSLINSI